MNYPPLLQIFALTLVSGSTESSSVYVSHRADIVVNWKTKVAALSPIGVGTDLVFRSLGGDPANIIMTTREAPVCGLESPDLGLAVPEKGQISYRYGEWSFRRGEHSNNIYSFYGYRILGRREMKFVFKSGVGVLEIDNIHRIGRKMVAAAEFKYQGGRHLLDIC
jgi:hypothetical protein